MFDTTIAIVGNVLTMPEWRRVDRTQALVANFKVASTARRFDRGSNRWVDGDSLRVRVTCWRRLAEGVVASIKVGDPVVVTGRLYTREWTTEEGQRRTAYELEATAVGHDLARGIGQFKRMRASVSTTVVEDADGDNRIGGEPSEAVPELNERSGALLAEEFDDDDFFNRPGLDEPGVGFGPEDGGFAPPFADLGTVLAAGPTAGRPPADSAPVDPAPVDPATVDAASAEPPSAEPLSAPPAGGQPAAAADVADVSRGRRGRGRVPANV